MVGKLCGLRVWGLFLFSLILLGGPPAVGQDDTPKKQLPMHGARAIVLWDKDSTFQYNVQNFVVFRCDVPAAETHLFTLEGLAPEVLVPNHDYESPLRGIEHLLGYYDKRGKFHIGSMKPVTLSNGTTFIPGYYYFDPSASRSLREFFPHPDGGDRSHYVERIMQAIREKRKFLDMAAPFVRDALNPEYADRVRSIALTAQGINTTEFQRGIGKIAKASGWTEVDPTLAKLVALSDTRLWGHFKGEKKRFMESLWETLNHVGLENSSVDYGGSSELKKTHYVVYFENARKHLNPSADFWRKTANNGFYEFRVVPIIVNAEEETIFRNPGGYDPTKTPRYSPKKNYRVTIYEGQAQVIETNRLSIIFEKIHGMSESEAKKHYKKMMRGTRKWSCRDLAEGGNPKYENERRLDEEDEG